MWEKGWSQKLMLDKDKILTMLSLILRPECQPISHINILLRGWVWRFWYLILILPPESFNCHLKGHCWKCTKMKATRFNRSCARNKAKLLLSWTRHLTSGNSDFSETNQQLSSKVCECDLDSFLSRTPIFDWCVVWWWSKRLSMGISCLKEVGLFLQIVLTALQPIVATIEKTYAHSIGINKHHLSA